MTLNGEAYCWGGNAVGQLGASTRGEYDDEGIPYSSTPIAVTGGLTFASLSAGSQHTCGVALDGRTYCWGNNVYGALGAVTSEKCFQAPCSTSPIAVTGGPTFVSVSVGFDHTCGVTAGGVAYCWGRNLEGQLGGASSDQCGPSQARCSSTPIAVTGGLTFASLSAGWMHTCGMALDGRTYCWGDSYQQHDTPQPVSGGLTLVTVSGGASHTCGLTGDGVAYCWGLDNYGSVGSGDTESCLFAGERCSPRPVAVRGGHIFASVAAGVHSCAVTSDGAAYCWGMNFFGQLGNGTTAHSDLPVLVAGELSFTQVTLGSGHTCGVTLDDVVYCWGRNEVWGQLGDGTTANRSSPGAVSGSAL